MKENKIRILYIASMNVDSGVACFLMNYVRHMDLSRFSLSFLTLQVREQTFHQELTNLGCTIYEVCDYKKHPAQWLKQVKRIIESGEFDIVHANEAVMGLPALYFSWRKKVPVRIAHSHSTNMPTKLKTLVVYLCRPLFGVLANQLFACSEAAGRYLFGKKPDIKHDICKLPNAIDTDKFAFSYENRRKVRELLGLENKLVLGHVGRFNVLKNQSFLIEVFDKVDQMREDAVLILIGDGETRAEIEERVKQKHLEDKIIFLGIELNPEIYYSAMDIFLLPSLCEGFGIVNIEAQANGLICIVSEAVPDEALILDSVRRISLADPNEWAQAILQCAAGMQTTKRSESLQYVEEAGYGIKDSVIVLEDKYVALLNEYQHG